MRATQRVPVAIWLLCAAAQLVACDGDDNATPTLKEMDAGQDASRPQDQTMHLADHSAGVACEHDADCEGGRCELQAAANGGFCTRTCASKSACGTGALCSKDGNGDGLCLQTCATAADCRDGFVCSGASNGGLISFVGSCQPLAPVGTLADGVAGDACEQDDDCEGGKCATKNLLGTSYPGNYCSGDCYEDSQCGQGGVCFWPLGRVEPGSCLRQCDSQADCSRDGYRCWELGDGSRLFHACYPGATPLPDHATGKPCDLDADCAAPASCAHELPYGSLSAEAEITTAAGGYCTQECSFDTDCGAGAQCINRARLGGICLASCTDTEPCRDGYLCAAHLRDADPNAKVCLPQAPDTDADAGLP